MIGAEPLAGHRQECLARRRQVEWRNRDRLAPRHSLRALLAADRDHQAKPANRGKLS